MDKEKHNLQSRTKTFSLDVIKLYQKLPKTTDAQIIGKQLFRSATSVGANTRASFRGRSKKEFIAKMGTVIEEADESIYWLELLKEAGISKNSLIDQLIEESNSLVSIFISIVNKTKNG